MRVIGEKNQISEDVFDFMISYLPFPKSQSVLNLLNFFPSVYYKMKFSYVEKVSNNTMSMTMNLPLPIVFFLTTTDLKCLQMVLNDLISSIVMY